MTKTNSLARQFPMGLALVAGLALSSPAAWALGSTPVTVTNPSVPVTVGNPNNPAAFAKAQGIQHPFQTTIGCTSAAVGGLPFECAGSLDLAATIPGQRLVIEHYAVQCQFTPGQSLFLAEFDTIIGGGLNDTAHNVPITDHVGARNNANVTFVSLGQLTRIYADANSIISVRASVGPSANLQQTPLSCFFQLSGQAIDP